MNDLARRLLKSTCMREIKFIAALLIAVACIGLQQAKADSVTYTLTQGNTAIPGYTAPYAHVVVDLNAVTNTATITFTSLTNSGNIYLFGGGSSVAVNVNAISWELGTITGAQQRHRIRTGIYRNGGSGNTDGFGVLNQTINSFGGFRHSSSTISLTLTNTSGTWTSASQVLAANAQGAFAAAHIFVTKSPANVRRNGNLSTGFAANGGPQVPDGGATVMLLGAALGALGVLRRYASR
jgi:VPDSG-CTERM motif